ncbi:ABC transporter substrate-binding protein [Microbacterium sp. NPDC058342]|uniref:ABC transporter substrate-binding protein n=1 Tax=Microbacterium sp. NPDC058342 TaxID=3346454 RepID=UPI003651BF8D
MRRSALAISLLLAVGLTASACAGAPAESAERPASTSGATDSAEWPRTIEHAMGSTEIDAPPLRIVALDNSYVDATILLESDVVGYTTYRSVDGTFPEYLGEAAQEYAGEATSVGVITEPDLEAIHALDPDLIISAKVRHEKIYDQLSQIAPTVMSETTGPTWQENIRLLASALGKEELAEAKLETYLAAAETVGAEINEKAGDPTISVVRFLDGPTRLYLNATFSGIVLQDMNLARPKAQDVDDFAIEINEEQIGLAEADRIFVTTFAGEDDLGVKTKERFALNPLWKPLAPKTVDVSDEAWMTAVSVQGAYEIMSDLADAFDVEGPAGAESVVG